MNVTHWMRGKKSSGALNKWFIDALNAGPTADMWCLHGDNLSTVASLDIWSVMPNMLKVAQEVDDRYWPITPP